MRSFSYAVFGLLLLSFAPATSHAKDYDDEIERLNRIYRLRMNDADSTQEQRRIRDAYDEAVEKLKEKYGVGRRPIGYGNSRDRWGRPQNPGRDDREVGNGNVNEDFYLDGRNAGARLDQITKTLEARIASMKKANEANVKQNELIKLVQAVNDALSKKPEPKEDETPEQRAQARIANYMTALKKMEELPRALLKEYKEDLERLERYKGSNELNNAASDLLQFLADPRGEEQKGAKGVGVTGVSRTSKPEENKEIKPIEDALSEYESLKSVRGQCSALSSDMTQKMQVMEVMMETENRAYDQKKSQLQKGIKDKKVLRKQVEIAVLKSKSQDKGAKNVMNATETLAMLFEGEIQGLPAGKKPEDVIQDQITDFIIANRYEMKPLSNGAENFEALGKDQTLYVEALANQTDATAGFTLTAKGRKVFGDILGLDKGNYSGSVINKVSANSLRYIDKVWKNTIDAIQAAKSDPTYRSASDQIEQDEKELGELETNHKAKVEKIAEGSGLARTCVNDMMQAERGVFGLDSTTHKDKVCEACEKMRAAIKTHKDTADKVKKVTGDQK